MTRSEQQIQVTHLLEAVQQNDAGAADHLFSLLYEELRRMAGAQMSNEGQAITLQPTALVHEVWIKLIGRDQEQNWQSQRHFFVVAARAMRRILVDAARARTSQKRGGKERPLQFTHLDSEAVVKDQELIELDDALGLLKQISPEKGTLVELRYFAGMTTAEAAQSLGISTSTAERYWVFAKAWLRKTMGSQHD